MEQTKVMWPGWEIVRLIGRGSFGAVYEIQRNLYGNVEKAALKVIEIPQSRSDIEELYNDGYDGESITLRFRSYLEDIVREYSLMARMKGHTNIVYCDDLQQIQHEDGMGWDIYIKMELLTPLTKALGKEVSEAQVVQIGTDICNALVLCKENNIVHRDIKPQNIFVSQDGNYKLGDFGIAKTAERTTSGTKVGTYKYMAPEVYKSQPYGVTADIYSLGLVLYWLLNERRMPFLPLPPAVPSASMEDDVRRRRFMGEKFPPPAHGSKELQAIVLKACAYDPKDRFASAKEMRAALLALGGNSTESPATVAATPTMQSNSMNNINVMPLVETVQSEYDATEGVFRGTPIKENTVSSPFDFGNYDTEGTVGTVGAFAAPPPPNQSQPKKNKKRVLLWCAILAGVIFTVLMIVLLAQGSRKTSKRSTNSGTSTADRSDNSSQYDGTERSDKSNTQSSTAENDNEPMQRDWTDWSDELPEYVTDKDYNIDKRTLYSSRTLETTTSTQSSVLDGWELYNTASGDGGYGPWSEWAQDAVSVTDAREVETQTRYRSRSKETTTGTDSTLSGWTQEGVSSVLGDYGPWSEWSTETVSSNDSRKVESATQYRYRTISYSEKYADWSGWSSWQSDSVSSDDLTDVETRTVYGYYWYECPNCGAHMHGWGFTCPTWAGGCGNAELRESYWHILWSTTSPDNVSFGDWHGTGHYYAYVDGVLVFRWDYGNTGPQTEYRYRTRSTEQETSYGTWSDWGEIEYSSSANQEVESRAVYRYCEREQVDIYTFYRWSGWSDWSTTVVESSSDVEVEAKDFYRYRDKVTQTTYYFRRWTDWSDYSETSVSASETVEVRTVTQYRYKSK